MRLVVPSLFVFAMLLVGCAPNKEAMVPGTWAVTDDRGQGANEMVFNKDHTLTSTQQGIPVKGKWSFANDTATATIESINGTPISDFLAKLKPLEKAMPADQVSKIEHVVDPIPFKIGDDGKSMTATWNGQNLVGKKTAEPK